MIEKNDRKEHVDHRGPVTIYPERGVVRVPDRVEDIHLNDNEMMALYLLPVGYTDLTPEKLRRAARDRNVEFTQAQAVNLLSKLRQKLGPGVVHHPRSKSYMLLPVEVGTGK